jgi:hypothetical protein
MSEELPNQNETMQLKHCWHPDRCPITLLPFFMWIHHPHHGWLPTYGGPFDSYTIPEPDFEDGDGEERYDWRYFRMRYDHDLGGWHDGVEQVEERVIFQDTLFDLGVWDE